MPLFHQLSLILVHIPKNAGTCLTDFLTQANGAPPAAEGHHPWTWYRDNFPQEWQHYHKVAVSRHPIDRFFSCYHYGRMLHSYWHSPDGSTAWPQHVDYALLSQANPDDAVRLLVKGKLQHPTWAPQALYCFDQTGQLQVDQVLRYESLTADMASLCARLQLPFSSLPRINRSDRPDQDFISPDSLRLLQRVYHNDFALLGYSIAVLPEST
jgi:hypothetical protein